MLLLHIVLKEEAAFCLLNKCLSIDLAALLAIALIAISFANLTATFLATLAAALTAMTFTGRIMVSGFGVGVHR